MNFKSSDPGFLLNPSIRTISGRMVDVLNPTPDMFCIEDIAHALANLCRFGGHCPQHYSVAQHSVLCALMSDKKRALSTLLHDASEAYLVDVPRPYKHLLTNYAEIEDRLMKVIASVFEFEYPMSPYIIRIDNSLLVREWNSFIVPKKGVKKIVPISNFEAKELFLNAYATIKAGKALRLSS